MLIFLFTSFVDNSYCLFVKSEEFDTSGDTSRLSKKNNASHHVKVMDPSSSDSSLSCIILNEAFFHMFKQWCNFLQAGE